MAKSVNRAQISEHFCIIAENIRVLSLFDGFFVIFKLKNRNTHCHEKSGVL